MESPREFDREFRFNEAVYEDDALSFINRLFELMGLPVLLVGEDGESLAVNGFQSSAFRPEEIAGRGLPIEPAELSSENGTGHRGFPVRHEGEVFALLVVPYTGNGEQTLAKAPALAALLESYFELKHKQRMIAEVHHSSLESNYRDLLKKNQELRESERRYRELAETLEIRVEERRKELEKTQQQLIQQEKMASIGQLAAGVAHEINNPTAFVRSNLQTLGTYIENLVGMINEYAAVEQDEKTRDQLDQRREELDIEYIVSDVGLLLQQSAKGCERIAKIVNGLSRFSHVDKTDSESFDMNGLIESALELLHNEIKHKAELRKELHDMPRIWGLPNQLNQVFVNIIVNALQAMEEFGTLTIKSSFENDHACVHIEDNGPGIAGEKLSRIFDPFYTTKPVGKGTGLGLSISYEIVKNHGGDIRVESAPGRGTAFKVIIPRQVISQGEGQ